METVIPVRAVTNKERLQRGCGICLYHARITSEAAARERRARNERIVGCAFHKCPFTELDEYESYLDYEKDAKNSSRLAEAFTALVESCGA